MKLYKVTAHFGRKSTVYYIVAPDPAEAERAVTSLHETRGWFSVDYCDIETVAEQYAYGKPAPLCVQGKWGDES